MQAGSTEQSPKEFFFCVCVCVGGGGGGGGGIRHWYYSITSKGPAILGIDALFFVCTDKHLIGLTLGVTFAVAASFVLFSLLILGLCMLSRCPMRKAYSYKPVIVPDPNVARAEEVEGGRVVRGGEGSGRGGRTRTPDQDPLMHDDEMKTADD